MKIKLYYILLAAVIVTSSCKKDFLTQIPPTAAPVALAIKTDNDMADALNGMYADMRSSSLFGRDVPVLGDEFADNTYVLATNSGRYLSENNFTMTNQNAEAADIFAQSYTCILQANRIINASAPVDAASNQMRGEAYTSRALLYLTLVNFFAQPYTVSTTAPGVPIVTGYGGPFTLPARNTVGEVYARIIKDLDSAYVLMPTTAISSTYHPTNSEYIGKYVAKGLEARAYLYMGDYANAITAALLVVNNGGYTLTPSTSLAAYWANAAPQTGKVETMFELGLNLTTNNGTNGLDYIYSPSGYGDIAATNNLYDSYSTTDVRRALILNTTRYGLQTYVVNKYPNISSASDRDDLKIIRYAEVLLTLGEAYARTNDNLNGQLYINQVAKQRDPAFLGYADVGTALVADALNERRKELAFEGLRYFDLTRQNIAYTRPVQSQGASSLSNIPVGFTFKLLPIPFAELNANPNITQNPGY